VAQNVYECMVILDPNKYAQDPGGLGATIPNLVAKCGGEVLVSRLWQEQKLAYPIGSHKKGTYWLTYFRLDSNQLDNLTRQCHLNENIIRQLFVRLDPRIVEPLVQHALVGPAEKPKPAAVAAPSRAAAILPPDVPVVDALADIDDE
jgi:small subunit ribosomal protein S6